MLTAYSSGAHNAIAIPSTLPLDLIRKLPANIALMPTMAIKIRRPHAAGD
jgi:hypothetical protein